MPRSNDRNKRSTGRSRKYGVKDENIDRQILVLHRAMANKLLKHPELLPQIQQNLELRHREGRTGYGAYLTWSAILELLSEPAQFLAAMLEQSPKMRRLRRDTPFIGLLSEEERLTALHDSACGEVDITTLL